MIQWWNIVTYRTLDLNQGMVQKVRLTWKIACQQIISNHFYNTYYTPTLNKYFKRWINYEMLVEIK